MNFIFFILAVLFTFWSIYEFSTKESAFPKQVTRKENPQTYWAQTISFLLIGLILLWLYLF